jgi:hypothetical protein
MYQDVFFCEIGGLHQKNVSSKTAVYNRISLLATFVATGSQGHPNSHTLIFRH